MARSRTYDVNDEHEKRQRHHQGEVPVDLHRLPQEVVGASARITSRSVMNVGKALAQAQRPRVTVAVIIRIVW